MLLITRNDGRALGLLRRAAAGGLSTEDLVGELFDLGAVVTPDDRVAAELIAEAAEATSVSEDLEYVRGRLLALASLHGDIRATLATGETHVEAWEARAHQPSQTITRALIPG